MACSAKFSRSARVKDTTERRNSRKSEQTLGRIFVLVGLALNNLQIRGRERESVRIYTKETLIRPWSNRARTWRGFGDWFGRADLPFWFARGAVVIHLAVIFPRHCNSTEIVNQFRSNKGEYFRNDAKCLNCGRLAARPASDASCHLKNRNIPSAICPLGYRKCKANSSRTHPKVADTKLRGSWLDSASAVSGSSDSNGRPRGSTVYLVLS